MDFINTKVSSKNNYHKVSNTLCFILLFEPVVINAIAGADLYCIVDACSVDGWVFVEKVT